MHNSKLSVSEQLLAERYISGGMSEEERNEVEAMLLWSPALREEVELIGLLREGLSAETYLPRKDARQAMRHSSGPLSRLTTGFLQITGYRQRWFVAGGATAALAISLTTHSGWWPGIVQRDGIQAQPILSANVFTLETIRGSSTPAAINVIRRGTDSAWITLLVYTDIIDSQDLRISVDRVEAGAPRVGVWQQGLAAPGYSEAIAITMPGDRLEPGKHVLRIEDGTSAHAQELARVSFRVE